MLKKTLVFVLAVAVVPMQAQQFGSISPFDARWAYIQAEMNDPVLTAPEFVALRRGSEESFFVKAKTGLTDADRASQYWGAAAPHNGRFLPTELQIEPAGGFSVRAIRYERPQKVLLIPGDPDLVLGPSSTEFHFKLKTAADLVPGTYVLRGKLRFQQISRTSTSEPQEVPFAIPVQVVEHDAKVVKNSAYPFEMSPADWVGVILLMPILLPITLLTWDGC
jgi:hypothetical protein